MQSIAFSCVRRLLPVYTASAAMLCLVACHQPEPLPPARGLLLSHSDQDFITETERLAMRDRALGNIMERKSAKEDIKRYADSVVRNDTDALQRLDVMMLQYKFEAPSVSVGEHVPDEVTMKDWPRNSLDRRFVNFILKDDERAVRVLQDEARSQGDSVLRQYASDLLPQFQSELKQGQSLQQKYSASRARKSNF
jgi:hypothetical protein